jgi:hypothetical protein
LAALAQLTQLHSVEIVSPRRAIRRRGTTVSKGLWLNMLQALPFLPPTVQHVRLYVNLWHVLPAALGDLDSSQIQSKLSGCTSLRSLELALTTEHKHLIIPIEAEKCEGIQEAVRSKILPKFSKILSFV